MTTYRAIVSIEFTDADLVELAVDLGVKPEHMDPSACVQGDLDNLCLGSSWLEQLFRDGNPTMLRLSRGIAVEVNPH